MSIIVLGTVALDSVKTPFGRRKELLGGSAAHFSMAARLFTKVNLVAIVRVIRSMTWIFTPEWRIRSRSSEARYRCIFSPVSIRLPSNNGAMTN